MSRATKNSKKEADSGRSKDSAAAPMCDLCDGPLKASEQVLRRLPKAPTSLLRRYLQEPLRWTHSQLYTVRMPRVYSEPT